jgi:hypothetical protein
MSVSETPVRRSDAKPMSRQKQRGMVRLMELAKASPPFSKASNPGAQNEIHDFRQVESEP